MTIPIRAHCPGWARTMRRYTPTPTPVPTTRCSARIVSPILEAPMCSTMSAERIAQYGCPTGETNIVEAARSTATAARPATRRAREPRWAPVRSR